MEIKTLRQGAILNLIIQSIWLYYAFCFNAQSSDFVTFKKEPFLQNCQLYTFIFNQFCPVLFYSPPAPV